MNLFNTVGPFNISTQVQVPYSERVKYNAQQNKPTYVQSFLVNDQTGLLNFSVRKITKETEHVTS